MAPGVGWQSVISGKAGIFSSTARLPYLPPLFLSPACCRGPLQAPWEHHNLPFAPCHLKISPTPSGSFSVLMSVHPMLTLTPSPRQRKQNRKTTGVNWGVERPCWASSPSMMF